MKKLLYIIVFLAMFSVSYANISKKFLIALEKVESNGNTLSIGDNGKAYGCLQIHECVIKDVNRIYKTDYKHKDAFYRKKAFEICVLYLTYWGNIYKKNYNKEPNNEIYARIWNGGTYGYKKNKTLKYWYKVKIYLK